MNQQTADIIGLSKGISRKYTSVSVRRNIVSYIADVYNTNKDFYSDEQIDKIIMEAFYDYIDSADVPSAFLKELNDNWTDRTCSLTTRILEAFSTVRVKNNNRYINGFNQKVLNKMDEAIKLDAMIKCPKDE